MAHRYVITIGAQLDERWSAWFDGLTISNGMNGNARLTGFVADQAALYGLLAKLRDLGVPVLALQPLPDEAEHVADPDQPTTAPGAST